MVFQEADLSVRVVRDIFSAHFEKAVVDDPKQHQRLASFFSPPPPPPPHPPPRARALGARVGVGGPPQPLFEAYGIDPVIDGMLSRRVDLASGGYLMIDY